MALKPYSELRKIDVSKHCDMREAKDDKGKKILVPYLNWAKCIDLLHEHGAEEVYYIPKKNPTTGGFVFSSADVANKDGRKTGCYFVSVEIHVDNLVFDMDMPLMNGSLVIYEDTLNQLRIDNCHKRAFVKGVAIRTGLGFHLWCSEKDTEDPTSVEDLSFHNVYKIKERIEQKITAKMQRGMSYDDILAQCGLSQKAFAKLMGMFSLVDQLERSLG